MKRILSLILAIIMLSSVLLSCGKSDDPSITEGTVTTESSEVNNPEDGLIDGAVYRILSSTLDRLEYAIKGNEFCSRNNMQCEITTYKGILSSLWRVRYVDDGSAILLESVATCERYLTVQPDSKSGNPITVSSPIDSKFSGQKFTPIKNDDGLYLLKEINSLYVLSASTETAGATVISEEQEDGKTLQLWKLVKTADADKQIPTLLPVSGDVVHSSTPEIIRDGDTYYMYVMTEKVWVKKSDDLRVWKGAAIAFDKADKKFPFSWMEKEVPGYGLWCPGIYEMNGKYYLYYALSTGGSQHSAICLAVNETLDVTSKKYKWVDKGVVLHSYVGDDFNAIDPQLFIDQDGISWLVYGSYWSGIKMRRVDPETGYLDESHPEVYSIARNAPRSSEDSAGAIEAPYIVYKDGYYYLFCATGRMNVGEYSNHVGRSENVTGPYVDSKGREMMDGYAEIVTQDTETISLCAHNSVFHDFDGQWYMVCEYFTAVEEHSHMLISTIVWTEDGWPTTALTPKLFK